MAMQMIQSGTPAPQQKNPALMGLVNSGGGNTPNPQAGVGGGAGNPMTPMGVVSGGGSNTPTPQASTPATNIVQGGGSNTPTPQAQSSAAPAQSAASNANVPPPQVQQPSVASYGGSANNIPQVQFNAADQTAAQQAAFNTAKDQVGQTSQSALTGLRSALASRGLLGSGAESRGTTNVLTQGQQQLGDTSRQQAITAADLAEKQNELQYTGGIQQRGQDLSAQQASNALAAQLAEAQYGGGVTERGQDIGYQESLNANNRSILQGLLGSLNLNLNY